MIQNTKYKYITSPIYYVNSVPHLGHLYTSLAVDVLGKLYKLFGYNVYCSYGTDEHGQKVESAANKANMDPQVYVDQSYIKFKNLLQVADIDFNCFTRTTDAKHKQTAIHIWNMIYANGFIYEGDYEGWYSQRDEAFYKEDEIDNGFAKESGSPVELLKEKCFFFKLSSFRGYLLEYYQANPDSIRPKSRYAEVMGMLKKDLPDLAISRSRFQWGIPVPNHSDHVMYVWIDALSSYLTSIGYPLNSNYENWWNNTTHILGKDILKFHAIYFPAILKAANIPFNNNIIAHGWWMANNKKMSKSVGNVVDPFDLIEKYGSDAIRYFLFKEVGFGSDGSFAEEDLIRCINTELVNEFGNLAQRVLMFCYNKYYATVTPSNINYDMEKSQPKSSCVSSGSSPSSPAFTQNPQTPNTHIIALWDNAFKLVEEKMNNADITGYVHILRSCIIATNKYIDDEKPWTQANPKDSLGILCFCLRKMAILASPILPNACAKLAKILGIKSFTTNEASQIIAMPLSKPIGLFTRK